MDQLPQLIRQDEPLLGNVSKLIKLLSLPAHHMQAYSKSQSTAKTRLRYLKRLIQL
jgi:hypothetical protein